MLLDLAVPRDVEPETAYVDHVRVVDIVSLRERLAAHDPAPRPTSRGPTSSSPRRSIGVTVRRRGDELAPLIRALRRTATT